MQSVCKDASLLSYVKTSGSKYPKKKIEAAVIGIRDLLQLLSHIDSK